MVEHSPTILTSEEKASTYFVVKLNVLKASCLASVLFALDRQAGGEADRQADRQADRWRQKRSMAAYCRTLGGSVGQRGQIPAHFVPSDGPALLCIQRRAETRSLR